MLKKCIVFLMIFLLSGCNTSNRNFHQVKIYIGGGSGSDDCVFELIDKYTFTVKECVINNYDIKDENFIFQVINEDTVNFRKNSKMIYNMIDKISCLPEDDEFKFVAEDVNYIIALIDNRVYWTVCGNDYPEYSNELLLELVYKLIEMSPIIVGGDVNPILVPGKDKEKDKGTVETIEKVLVF